MLSLQVNGTQYTDFVSIEYTESMVEFNRQCDFQIALEKGEQVPFFANDNVIVLIDNVPVMEGYIYQAQVSYSVGSHIVSYVATDNSVDFADSEIDTINDLASSSTLVSVISEVLSHIGSEVTVSDKTTHGIEPFSEDEDRISPETGDGAFEYCDSLCMKRQVLMRTGSDGNIELIRNSGNTYKNPLVNIVDDIGQNNITSASYTYNIAESFRKYVVRSGKSSKSTFSLADSRNNDAANIELASQDGKFIDESNRAGRQKVFISQEASSNSDNEQQARWIADEARSTKISYSVTLASHSIGDEVLETNMLVRIEDEFTGVSDYMLIESISCKYSLGSGSTSSVKLIDKDSFTLKLEDPSRRYNDSEKDVGFSLGSA